MSRIAANNDFGITAAKGPKATSTNKSIIECVIPEIGVLPPDLTFITVRIVAPAPGRPPKKPSKPMKPKKGNK